MRPLRQPLECTLIEASLVDKIFYRIPEILAHHQVLLTTLSQRIDQWHKDAILGDVLLAHVGLGKQIIDEEGFFSVFEAIYD